MSDKLNESWSEHRSDIKKQTAFFSALAVALGGLLTGFSIYMLSAAVLFNTEQFYYNIIQEWLADNIFIIGCVIGASVVGIISEHFGRKKILIIASVLLFAYSIFSFISRSMIELIIIRLVGGLGIGFISVLSSLYIAEISPTKIRGRLINVNSLFIILGILLSNLAKSTLVIENPANWRVALGIAGIPAFVYLLSLIFIPESPRWLAGKKNGDSTSKSFNNSGTTVDAIHNSENRLFHSIIIQKNNRKVLLIGALIVFFQLFSGLNIVWYYLPQVLLNTGFKLSSINPHATYIAGITSLLCLIFVFFYIDTYGRKPLLLVGIGGMGIFLSLVGFALNTQIIDGLWILAPLIIYIGFYAISFGSVINVVLTELFPDSIRAQAMAVVMTVFWILFLIMSQITSLLIEAFAERIFFLFAGICAIAFSFIWIFLKETKGVPLDEIEKVWNNE